MNGKIQEIISFLNGFRKFTVMMLLIIIGVTFKLTGQLSGAEFVDLLRYTTVAFMSANGVEHIMNGVKEWLKKK